MKYEIKEILEELRTYKDRYEYFLFNNLSFSDRDYKAKILLDYITNLQKENRILKDKIKLRGDYITMTHEKIDKALKKIQYIIDYGFDYDGFNNVKDLKGLIDMLVDYARKSKDILEGDK